MARKRKSTLKCGGAIVNGRNKPFDKKIPDCPGKEKCNNSLFSYYGSGRNLYAYNRTRIFKGL